MVSHLEGMVGKIALLRELDAVGEMERRWDEWEDGNEEYGEFSADGPLSLDDCVEPDGEWAGGLGDFWRLTNGATFGSLWIHRQGQIRPTSVVDSLGEPIDDRNWLSIGSVDEQALVMDADSGTVMIYWYLYFKHRWDSGVVFECADIPELIDTVALGPKYPLTFGPPERQKSPWWERDSWYLYLCEIGLIHR